MFLKQKKFNVKKYSYAIDITHIEIVIVINKNLSSTALHKMSTRYCHTSNKQVKLSIRLSIILKLLIR